MAEGVQFNFKENYINFLQHKPTTLIPNSFVGNKIFGFGAINGPAIEKGAQFGDCMDGFGIKWEYPSTGGGAAVRLRSGDSCGNGGTDSGPFCAD